MPAIAVFAFVFVLLWATDRGPGQPRASGMRRWLLVAAVMLFLGGNRFNGADWINYKQAFEAVSVAPGPFAAAVESPLEWLFSLLLWAVGSLGLRYEIVVLLIGVFNTLALWHVIRRLGCQFEGRTLALLLLVEGWTLYHEQLRQSVAVTLCLLALLKAIDRRFLAMALLWVAATGFHSSALIAPMLLLLAHFVRRRGDQPVSVAGSALMALMLFVAISAMFYIVRHEMLPLPGLDRLHNKLTLYDEHDVFGGSLFTAGLVAYALGFLLLFPLRKRVAQRGSFWLSFTWSAALLWTMIGPLFRTEAILIRFEHYLLIFLPLALGLLLNDTPGPRLSGGWRTVAACVFAATFPLRVFANPENLVWSLDYQNYIVNPMLGQELEDEDIRQGLICANLALFDNDFCGRDLSTM